MGRHSVPNDELIIEGHLPDNFNFTTPFGMTLAGLAYKDADGETRLVIGERGPDDLEAAGMYDIPESIAGMEQLKNRIAQAVALANGIPTGVLPGGSTVAKGYGGFTVDIAQFTGPQSHAMTVVFLHFEALSGYVESSGNHTDISISPYTFEDIAEGLEAANVGFHLVWDFAGTGPFSLSAAPSPDAPGVSFVVFGDTSGATPRLGIRTVCTPARSKPGERSVFTGPGRPPYVHTFHYEGRCPASGTRTFSPEHQTTPLSLGWLATVNEQYCVHPINGAYSCIGVGLTELSVSDVNLDGLALTTTTRQSDSFRNHARIHWGQLSALPATVTGNIATSTVRYYWEDL